MRRSTYISVLAILCLQYGCLANPVKQDDGTLLEYSYRGFVHAHTSASSEGAARWTVAGLLTVHYFHGHIILQLSDIKTSVYNGLLDEVNKAVEKDLPEETHVLQKPFIIRITGDNVRIDVTPNEPLWCVNMKRAIGSQFLIDPRGLLAKSSTSNVTTTEKSVYGDCETTYELSGTDEETTTTKTINHEKCKGVPYKRKTNVEPSPASDHKPIHQETVRTYTTKSVEGKYVYTHVESSSNVSYQAMKISRSSQHIRQYQEFVMTSSQNSQDEKINTSEITVPRDIYYEYGLESTAGRHTYESDADVLTKIFLDNAAEFAKQSEDYSVRPYDIRSTDYIENMFLALLDMKEDGLKTLFNNMTESIQLKSFEILASLLPYIGTNHTVDMIEKMFTKNCYSFNYMQSVRFLSSLPTYIATPSEEMLVKLDVLMHLDKWKLNPLMNSGILSFASVVANTNKKGALSESKRHKYVKTFHKEFINSEDYETRMVHLLGLINMADLLNTDDIIPIITNTSESQHIRSLAAYGFKKQLQAEPNKVFDTFWPMVGNHQEPFDLRVAAMDVLLSSALTEQQFNKMVDDFTEYKSGRAEQHLANYFYTTLLSLENITGYQDPLGDLATAALKTNNFRTYPQVWTTGNYRVSYTDGGVNIGAYMQARVVSDPNSNAFNLIQLTYNSFAMSYNLGTYNIYLKVDGLSDVFFRYNFGRQLQDIGIPELLEILAEIQCHFKDKFNPHVEFIVFVDGRAVYALYGTNDNLDTVFDELRRDLVNFNTISFPVADYTSIPSDFGSAIKIMNDMEEVWSFKKERTSTEGALLKLKSSWYFQTWVESYNPIADSMIASYKYFGDVIRVKLPFNINSNNKTLSWKNEKDMLIWSSDYLLGTTVEEEDVLNKYCSECDQYYEIPIDEDRHLVEYFEDIGLTLNVSKFTNANKSEILNKQSAKFTPFVKSHRDNTNVFPYARILLYANKFVQELVYVDRELSRILVRPEPFYTEPSESFLKLDYNLDDIKHIGPFEGSMNMSLTYCIKTLSDDEILSQFIMNYQFARYDQQNSTDNCDTNNTMQTIAQESRLAFNFASNNSIQYKIFIERDLLLPSRQLDAFSLLAPRNPITGRTTFRYTPNKKHCTNDYLFAGNCKNITKKWTEEYSISDDLIEHTKQMPEYETCENESAGLKYTPPTKACLTVHQLIEQYDRGVIYQVDDKQNFEDMDPKFIIKRFDGHKFNISVLNTPLHGEKKNDLDEVKYNDYIINYGIKIEDATRIAHTGGFLFNSACMLTPNMVRTFTGEYVSKYDSNVAFIDNGLNGLTVEKVNDKQIGFKLWTRQGNEDNVLNATVVGGRMKLMLNGQELSETLNDSSNYKVHFMDDDVIYVITDKVHVFYNTEYIMIKANSIYYNHICGLCKQENNKLH